jgi:hypothetical protein
MEAGLTYEWNVTGAIIEGSSTSAQVTLKMPSQVGIAVTISVRVTQPNGVFSTATEEFSTITAEAAAFKHELCELSRILARAPFWSAPIGPDPGPEGIVRIDPGDLSAFRDAASRVVDASSAALRMDTPVILSPGPRSTLAH